MHCECWDPSRKWHSAIVYTPLADAVVVDDVLARVRELKAALECTHCNRWISHA